MPVIVAEGAEESTNTVIIRGARGESVADILRRVGEINGVTIPPEATDLEALELFIEAAASGAIDSATAQAALAAAEAAIATTKAGEAAASALAAHNDKLAADADATATAADRTAVHADKLAADADATATAADRVQTGLDRIQTGLDAATSTAQAGIATAKAAEAAATVGLSTYPFPITNYSLIEYILDDAGIARLVATIGAAGAITYETPQSPEIVLETELLTYIGATSLTQMPSFYPLEVHAILDGNGDYRVSYAQTVAGHVRRFSDNVQSRAFLLVNYNPSFVGSGADRKLSVACPSPNPYSSLNIEHIWKRSTDALAAGTVRRTETYASTIVDRTRGLMAQQLLLSGAGYSGFGPWAESVNGSGVSYDPFGGTPYTTAPYNFQGGGDIHKNNYPLSWRLFINGAEWDLTLPYVGDAKVVKIEYEYKILRSRNPTLASTGNGFVHVFEEVTITPDRQLDQRVRATFQERWTGGVYSFIECFDSWPEILERTYPLVNGSAYGTIERLVLATYNASLTPTGNNGVRGVDWIAFSNAAGYRAQMRVTAPNSFVTANAPWGAPVITVNDGWTMKIIGDDPFKIYWYQETPTIVAVVGGTASQANAGDVLERSSNIFYETPV